MPLLIISPILVFILGFIVGFVVSRNDKKNVENDKMDKPDNKNDDDMYVAGDFWAYASAMKKTNLELKDFEYIYRDKVYKVEVLYNKKGSKVSDVRDDRVISGYHQEKLIPWIKVTSDEWSKAVELYELDVNSSFNKFEVIVDEDREKNVPEKVKNICKIMFNKLYENLKNAEKQRDIDEFGRDGK